MAAGSRRYQLHGSTPCSAALGAIEHHRFFLHFRVCYYQAIDFAIARA